MGTKGLSGKKLVLTLSWKMLSIILFAALVGLTVYTKPWEDSATSSRTMTIKGEASIKREPDSFVFNPMYETDSQESINAKTAEVIAGVKAAGLGDAGIQTNVSSYPKYDNSGVVEGKYTYSLSLTLAVEDKAVAQKVQDYLVGSNANGQITPQSTFKKETQKQLKDEATTKAVEDAKARAERTARDLGAKVGRVIEIKEPDGDMGVMPIASMEAMDAKMMTSTSLPINSGESEYNYTVEVIFEIK